LGRELGAASRRRLLTARAPDVRRDGNSSSLLVVEASGGSGAAGVVDVARACTAVSRMLVVGRQRSREHITGTTLVDERGRWGGRWLRGSTRLVMAAV